MNKQIELFKQGTPNVRVYVNPDFYDSVTVVWPYKNGFSDLSHDGSICGHFTDTKTNRVYQNPIDASKTKHLGKKTKWEDLPKPVQNSILYLFPLVWDLNK